MERAFKGEKKEKALKKRAIANARDEEIYFFEEAMGNRMLYLGGNEKAMRNFGFGKSDDVIIGKGHTDVRENDRKPKRLWRKSINIIH